MNCPHENVFEGFCEECGEMVMIFESPKFCENHEIIPKRKINPIDEIEGIPDKIRGIARDNIKRNDSKNTFIEIYSALLLNGEIFNPSKLCKELGIDRAKISECLKEISGTALKSTNSKSLSIVLVTPEVYAVDICKDKGLDIYIPEIKDMIKREMEADKHLIDMKPSHVASACIKKFMRTQGVEVKNFIAYGVSEDAIKKVCLDGPKLPDVEKLEKLSFEEYNPSTITASGRFKNFTEDSFIGDTTLDIAKTVRFLPITYLFEEDGTRLKRSDPPKDIPDGSIIGIAKSGYSRGIREGSMNNMNSLDMKLGDRNIHTKISPAKISLVGGKSFENCKKIIDIIIGHLNKLKDDMNFTSKLGREKTEKCLAKLKKGCNEYLKYVSNSSDSSDSSDSSGKEEGKEEGKEAKRTEKEILEERKKFFDDFLLTPEIKGDGENEEDEEERRMYEIFSRYSMEKFNKISDYVFLMKDFCSTEGIFEGRLVVPELTIYNSVYHIKKGRGDKRVSLIHIANHLHKKGHKMQFHNWFSEGLTICRDVKGYEEDVKVYKHRFTIHSSGTIKLVSPSFKEESYGFYSDVIDDINEALSLV